MIRWARRSDGAAIVRYIHELADYERLAHQCRAALDRIDQHLFGPHPVCEALVAVDEAADEVVGFALFFTAYSTFESAPYLWLEDLYVTPRARGKGHGKRLLTTLAAITLERGLPRLQWNVLDWNAPAIEFYQRLGAQILPDWRICRVDGEGLAVLGGGAAVPVVPG
jgi:GNAT superfamily N-acetyltransferase